MLFDKELFPDHKNNLSAALNWLPFVPVEQNVYDTHMEKLFYSIQYKNGCLATSDLFHMFTQSIKFHSLKKRLWHRCFPIIFVKFVKTPFFTEHFRWLLLDWY